MIREKLWKDYAVLSKFDPKVISGETVKMVQCFFGWRASNGMSSNTIESDNTGLKQYFKQLCGQYHDRALFQDAQGNWRGNPMLDISLISTYRDIKKMQAGMGVRQHARALLVADLRKFLEFLERPDAKAANGKLIPKFTKIWLKVSL